MISARTWTGAAAIALAVARPTPLLPPVTMIRTLFHSL
jgi:hypothetical protein